jgi:hypothetical protein
MSTLPDGRELICTLHVPMPVALAGALAGAISEAAEQLGYTDVVMEAGTHRVMARKPQPEEIDDHG